MEWALQDLKAKREEITETGTTLETDIDKEIEHLKQQLDQLKAKRIAELKKLIRQKQKRLGDHQRRLETTQTKLGRCVKEVEGKLKSLDSVVTEKTSLMKHIEQTSADIDIHSIQPDIKWGVELQLDDEKFQKACQEAFKLKETGITDFDIDSSYVTEDKVINATVEKQRTVVFHAMTKQKKTCEANVSLQTQLVKVRSSDKTKCEVVKKHNGKYNIEFTAAARGMYDLHMTVDTSPVPGSPFKVAVAPSTQSLSKPIRVVNDLPSIRGVAVNSKNQMVVVEGNGTCVSVLTLEGTKIRTFGTGGSGNGQLSSPLGVTVDKEDNIYVVNHGNDRIQKFNELGEFVATFSTRGSGSQQIDCPHGICYNHTDGNLYIADTCNHRIQVLSPDLKRSVKTIGSRGSGSGLFNTPQDMC